MRFGLFLVAIVASQETVKDRWVKTAGEDYNVVGKVSSNCLGLVSKGRVIYTISNCLQGATRYEVAAPSTVESLKRGNPNVQVSQSGAPGPRAISDYVSIVTLNARGNEFTPLRSVSIVDNFDYHVNFVAYRFMGSTLEKRSFKFVNPTLCFNKYREVYGNINEQKFKADLFCVESTFPGQVQLPQGSPLIARPRNTTTERYVSGIFWAAIPNSQLFYFAKPKGLAEF